MDYIAFCRSYFNITQIPVSLLEKEQPVYSTLSEALSIEPLMAFEMFPLRHNPTSVPCPRK